MDALVRAASLAGYAELALELGADPQAELVKCQLPDDLMAQPDMLISYQAMAQLLENTAQTTHCSSFGLQMAQRQSLEQLGAFGLLIRHCKTLQHSIEEAATYMFIHSPALRIEIRTVPKKNQFVDVCLMLNISIVPTDVQLLEFNLGLTVHFIQQVTGGKAAIERIFFPHAQHSNSTEYAKVFPCSIDFKAPLSAIRIHQKALDLPILYRDPTLYHLAESFIQKNYTNRNLSLTERVRLSIREQMGVMNFNQTSIAQALNIPPKTLQRRLAKEQETLEKIIEDERQKLFDRLLSQTPKLTFTQIALMLNYTESATLTRSCQRWFGCTPTQRRQAKSI